MFHPLQHRQFPLSGVPVGNLQTYGPLQAPTGYGSFAALPGIAAVYDTLTYSSMRNAAGSVPASNDAIKLIGDVSGNSNTNCLCNVGGVAGNNASTPNTGTISAAVGDIDVRIRLNGRGTLLSVDNTFICGNRDATTGWSFYWLTNVIYFQPVIGGVLQQVGVGISGATLTSFNSANYIKLLGKPNDAGGRSITVYTSSDGTTYSQLVTQSSAGSGGAISTPASPLTVLGRGVSAPGSAGPVFQMDFRNGDGGSLMATFNPSTAAKLATSIVASTGETWTINTTGDLGARISGERDLVQMTAANQPVYLPWDNTNGNYMWLNGVIGNYASAPNAAPLQITGDIDLRAQIGLSNWANGSVTYYPIAKFSASPNFAYAFGVTPTGALSLAISTTGADAPSVNSTSTVGFSANQISWIRVTRAQTGGITNFYTSTDGISWSQLGTANLVLSSGSAIFSGTNSLAIGTVNAATAPLLGKVYRAQIYNGIAGTLAFDFNPATYTSGAAFAESSSNAATVTINGGATIVTRTSLYFDGVNDYMKAAGFSITTPMSVYFVGQQVTWTLADYILDGGAANTFGLSQRTATPELDIVGGSVVAGNTGLPVATNGVVGMVWSTSTSASLRINRLTATTGNENQGVASNGFTLGAAGSAVQFGNIRCLGVYLFSVAHDTVTQNKMITMLANRYGIAV